MDVYPESTLRFLDAASVMGFVIEPIAFPEGTRTAADAADALQCDVSAIVKSLIFMVDDEPVVALVPGDLRLDPAKLAAVHGGRRSRRATLDEVRRHSGYAAGGTPPIGHPAPLPTFADVHLRRHEHVWAAAGTPTTVFAIEVDKLIELARATWADLAEGA